MSEYLEFKKAYCKNCYKCLRNCPVKAIKLVDQQAVIIDDKCILCGKCTHECYQNAKHVHSERSKIESILASSPKVIASVAPSFVSSFEIDDFNVFKIALLKLGFADADETAVGAAMVSNRYSEDLKTGKYKNYITSACPSVVRLIQKYYPNALSYLAQVDSPMIAHAKMLRKNNPGAKIIFIGPCIAKKREGDESHLIDGVLTFEELKNMFNDNGIVLDEIARLGNNKSGIISARNYPVDRGIIKSLPYKPEGYEYIGITGVKKCMEALEHIDQLEGVFLELNACEFGCVNGPCSTRSGEESIKCVTEVRKYAKQGTVEALIDNDVSLDAFYLRLDNPKIKFTEAQIRDVLAQTGKRKKEDELNCGCCGYDTCREKAVAVLEGYADVGMCLPFMRERAESLSYEILQNTPNGVLLLDHEMKIADINQKAMELWGIEDKDIKGKDYFDYIDAVEFMIAMNDGKGLNKKKLFIAKTNKYIELSIIILKKQNVIFGIMKDITDTVKTDDQLKKIKLETLETTDEVIKKQMRVAQEIASLLGETTAETKVALLKLKGTLLKESEEDN